MIGLFILGHGEQYWKSVDNYLDFARILLTFCSIIIMLNSHHWDVAGRVELKTILAVTMWLRWIRVLYSSRGFEMSGQHTLAIVYAAGSVWPFLAVVVWPLLGFINMYYMMGLYDLWRSGIILYRMAFIGDFDLDEVENISPTLERDGNPLDDGFYQEQDPVQTDNNKVLSVFMVVVTMFFTLALMNIFIGVLSERYSFYFERRDRLFLQTRAQIVCENAAITKATRAIKAYFSCGRRRIQPGSDDDITDDNTIAEYLWFCRQKKPDELGLDDEDDHDDGTGDVRSILERVEKMEVDISRMSNLMSSFIIKNEELNTDQTAMLETIVRTHSCQVP
jgi:hypothetical protein